MTTDQPTPQPEAFEDAPWNAMAMGYPQPEPTPAPTVDREALKAAAQGAIAGAMRDWLGAEPDQDADEWYERDTSKAAREAVDAVLAALPEAVCTCPWVDPKFWTTYYGAVEPGSTQEYDPTCPTHGVLRSRVEMAEKWQRFDAAMRRGKCECGATYASYEGPVEECPLHGRSHSEWVLMADEACVTRDAAVGKADLLWRDHRQACHDGSVDPECATCCAVEVEMPVNSQSVQHLTLDVERLTRERDEALAHVVALRALVGASDRVGMDLLDRAEKAEDKMRAVEHYRDEVCGCYGQDLSINRATVLKRLTEILGSGCALAGGAPQQVEGATHPAHWERHGHPGTPCTDASRCYGGANVQQVEGDEGAGSDG